MDGYMDVTTVYMDGCMDGCRYCYLDGWIDRCTRLIVEIYKGNLKSSLIYVTYFQNPNLYLYNNP